MNHLEHTTGWAAQADPRPLHRAAFAAYRHGRHGAVLLRFWRAAYERGIGWGEVEWWQLRLADGRTQGTLPAPVAVEDLHRWADAAVAAAATREPNTEG
ncbi:MAG TPA: hypothetical protein VF796_13615 [Humisphaera sp.]